MKRRNPLGLILALALLVVPVGASIQAMNLYDYMHVTNEAMHGTIVSKETFKSDYPDRGTVYTRLVVEGDAWRSEKPMSAELVYMGSHDPKDRFFVSEMPEFRDVRLGNEVVVFWGEDERLAGGAKVIWNLSGVYRIERGFGEPVVIGKGEGFAFTENIKLADARARVRATHALIQAEAQAQPHDHK